MQYQSSAKGLLIAFKIWVLSLVWIEPVANNYILINSMLDNLFDLTGIGSNQDEIFVLMNVQLILQCRRAVRITMGPPENQAFAIISANAFFMRCVIACLTSPDRI
jgi:hypothetical protein